MIINQQVLAETRKSFSALFQQAYEQATPQWDRLASLIPSTGAEVGYKWLGKIPQLREWLDERVIQNLEAFDYTLKNKHYEATVEIDRDDISDDNLGIYRPAILTMGEAARLHPDVLLFDLLKNGETNLCYDGKAFFAIDHPEGGVQSNYLTGTGTALSAASFATALATLRSVKSATKNEQGAYEPFPVGDKFLLVVPPALQKTAGEILNAEIISNTTNVLRGAADLFVADRLSDKPLAWYLIAVGKAVKPFVFQLREEVVFVSQDKPEDEANFMRKKFRYGVDYRGNAGYALWQLAVKNKGEV